MIQIYTRVDSCWQATHEVWEDSIAIFLEGVINMSNCITRFSRITAMNNTIMLRNKYRNVVGICREIMRMIVNITGCGQMNNILEITTYLGSIYRVKRQYTRINWGWYVMSPCDPHKSLLSWLANSTIRHAQSHAEASIPATFNWKTIWNQEWFVQWYIDLLGCILPYNRPVD